jgi:hypothetical protein
MKKLQLLESINLYIHQVKQKDLKLKTEVEKVYQKTVEKNCQNN